jgi:23S rRNA pseudouridine1911/1915/1917 synthase
MQSTANIESQEESSLTVAPEQAGERLDRFIADRVADLTRSRIQTLIREGCILLNAATARPSESLHSGDKVTIHLPASRPVEGMVSEDIALDILFEDEVMLVINKPPGMVVHPGAGVPSGTVVNALLHHTGSLSVIGGIERPGIVHRLDRETSGCLVVAKSDTAHQRLAEQFAGRTIEKTYLAIVDIKPLRATGTITAGIARHRVNRQKMTVSERPEARSAETTYKVLKADSGLHLLECKPKTGRTHQIRVHLKHLGCPIAGDSVYGKRGNFERHLLHAWQIAFDHPVTGIRQTITAPVPADFPLAP